MAVFQWPNRSESGEWEADYFSLDNEPMVDPNGTGNEKGNVSDPFGLGKTEMKKEKMKCPYPFGLLLLDLSVDGGLWTTVQNKTPPKRGLFNSRELSSRS